jgi:ribonuclease HI
MLTTLISSGPASPLLLYFVASHNVVNAALVQERYKDGKLQQYPIYFVSEVLTNSKCNMTELKNSICSPYGITQTEALLRGAQDKSPIDQGRDLFKTHEASAKIAKWAAKRFGYNITFEPRTTTKSQVLTDFIVDWIGSSTDNYCNTEAIWTIHYDDAWCHAGEGTATIITTPSGAKYKYVAHLRIALESDKCTNKIAEYEAVILGLWKLKALGVKTCIVKTDSKIIARQIEKDCIAREPVLKQYLSVVRSL